MKFFLSPALYGTNDCNEGVVDLWIFSEFICNPYVNGVCICFGSGREHLNSPKNPHENIDIYNKLRLQFLEIMTCSGTILSQLKKLIFCETNYYLMLFIIQQIKVRIKANEA